MRELRSAIESLRSESLSTLPHARVEQDFAELYAAVEALEAERLRRLAEIDRRRSFERDGFLSAASWLTGRFSVAWGQARDSVRFARALDQMNRALRAFEHGEISMSAVRILAEAREAEPQAFGAAESTLVDAASRHSIGDLRRVVAHWRHLVEQERAGIPGADDALRARRRLHASVTLHGSVRVEGDLDPETGETLLTALRAVLDADARSHGGPDGDRDDRSPAQRRADALGEICRSWLDRSDRPQVAGDRPHISVTVPMEVLTTGQGSLEDGARPSPPSSSQSGTTRGELDHTGPVDAQTLRRLACDASVTRIVLGPRSEPLDVGRKTPVVPPAIRRAVVARDRRCRFPGCDRPQSWCDAHHIRHGAGGGETSAGNLVLLCRRHHRSVHSGFTLQTVDGRPVFRRPDGEVLHDPAGRGPPLAAIV